MYAAHSKTVAIIFYILFDIKLENIYAESRTENIFGSTRRDEKLSVNLHCALTFKIGIIFELYFYGYPLPLKNKCTAHAILFWIMK